MSKHIFYLVLISCCLSCQSTPKKQEAIEPKLPMGIEGEILQKSIKTHGSWQQWQDLKSIRYTKRTKLLRQDGTLEKDISQLHQYQLHPSLKVRIDWEEKGTNHLIIYDGKNAIQYRDGIVSNQNALGSVQAAHYVLFQPFKLVDENATLQYMGIDTLKDGLVVDKMAVHYDTGKSKDDHWVYFFDKENGTIQSTWVNHGKGASLIQNLKTEKIDGILFNTERVSFTSDSLYQALWKRAEYWYGDYECNVKLEETLFEQLD